MPGATKSDAVAGLLVRPGVQEHAVPLLECQSRRFQVSAACQPMINSRPVVMSSRKTRGASASNKRERTTS